MLQLAEIERFTVIHTVQWTNMDEIRYSWGKHHAFLADELYAQVNPAKWNVTRKIANPKYYDQWDFCGRVFTYFFYLVVLDIIENNITLEIPIMGKNSAKIYVKCYQGEEFEQAMRRGAFQGQDFLATEFKAYRLVLQWTRGGKSREKPIYINAKIRDWFYDKINNGKKYY